MKCDKCKNMPWKECGNDCKELEYCCHICKYVVKLKNYIKQLGDPYNNPDQCLACSMCKVYKHIPFFRFRNGICRLCIYLDRYRYTHTKDRFKEYAERFYINL